ncbi:[protein release factor]-glutamine N5-methyltransferase [Candidatus Ruthia magnifica str. Cm (Calyptogena magnifica)]|uniref:peptide chain release factor N(5)-glutamine methyltransferase n=1 Tax=Ruthia magnifica subsp. Calyptogena magnifica TaxID=413404 RepID=A1AX57_RUTMC|nr:peptide chain release factor N(5)-glutamine methyltransferase [Candidatus Ruthturnera calyptogenae]ABL02514.1 [protein release factor]-glutamine N5-methyltransferase [Candidatus Ruthia magnifica str. Cm (Calyptogena magnifica)]
MISIQDYLNSDIIDIVPLLSLALNKNHVQLITHYDYQPNNEEKTQLNQLIKQRQFGIPFAYLSGTKGFYHLDFKVTPSTLIPRPETELLIDIALGLFDKNQTCKVLDLGTGSGIIIITLGDKNPQWHLTATDSSINALDIAQQNAKTNINFQLGSWFKATPNQIFDLIISNPPYIKQSDPHLNDLSFEPQSALVSGKDGLDDIRTIINNAPQHLNKKGYILLEHGFDQQQEIIQLLSNNFFNIQKFKDYNQQDRALLAQIK